MKKIFEFFVQDDSTAVNGKSNGAQNGGDMAEIEKENVANPAPNGAATIAPQAENAADAKQNGHVDENGKENQVKIREKAVSIRDFMSRGNPRAKS